MKSRTILLFIWVLAETRKSRILNNRILAENKSLLQTFKQNQKNEILIQPQKTKDYKNNSGTEKSNLRIRNIVGNDIGRKLKDVSKIKRKGVRLTNKSKEIDRMLKMKNLNMNGRKKRWQLLRMKRRAMSLISKKIKKRRQRSFVKFFIRTN